ncbi:unnamed protein product [Effrenium voratum]|uniref:Zinc finger protein n=1 Tax=Effrenium voratum TaxID=2562239 RepID=A0AA36MZT2_9DINO|nr:unnamed protein product [Effrenium voratum]
MAVAAVCASCPEAHQDTVSRLCLQHKIQKAFGRTGDMLDSLSGKDWIPKWEAKVVMATVTKAQTLGCKKALLICIAGGRHCDAEMARQPALVRAIKTEMGDPDFRVTMEWMDMEDFVEKYPDNDGGGGGKGKGKPTAAKSEAKCVDSGEGSKNCYGQEAAPDHAGKGKGAAKQVSQKASGKGKGDAKQANQKASDNSGKANGDAKQANQNASDNSGKANGDAKQANQKAPDNSGKANGDAKQANQKASEHAGKDQGSGQTNQPKASVNASKEKEAPKQKAGKSPAACKYWLQGNCKNGSSCAYAHGADTSASAKATSKTLCTYFAKGICKNGADCKFSHVTRSEDKAEKSTKSKTRAAKKLPCKSCGKTFKDWDSVVIKHFVCKGRKALCMCEQCNKTFADDLCCIQHQSATGHVGMARANDEKEPSWECGQCGLSFPTEAACVQHQEGTGHGDIPVCQTCSKSFQSENALRQHQQAVSHSGVFWVLEDDSDSDVSEVMEGPFLRCGCGREFASLDAGLQHQTATGHSNLPLVPVALDMAKCSAGKGSPADCPQS